MIRNGMIRVVLENGLTVSGLELQRTCAQLVVLLDHQHDITYRESEYAYIDNHV